MDHFRLVGVGEFATLETIQTCSNMYDQIMWYIWWIGISAPLMPPFCLSFTFQYCKWKQIRGLLMLKIFFLINTFLLLRCI